MAKAIIWRREKPLGQVAWSHVAYVPRGAMEYRVAVVVKTGSHLDDYPWDWYLTDHGEKLLREDGRRKQSGVSDTLRSAKNTVEDSLDLSKGLH